MASEEDVGAAAAGLLNLNSSIGGNKSETASNTSGSLSRKHRLIHQNSNQSNGLTMSPPPTSTAQVNGHHNHHHNHLNHHHQPDHQMHTKNLNGSMIKQQQLPPPPPPHHQMGKLYVFEKK